MYFRRCVEPGDNRNEDPTFPQRRRNKEADGTEWLLLDG